MLSPTAHHDTFTRDNLPAPDDWPLLEHVLPELQYPERLNAGAVLIDEGARRFGSERIALRTPQGEEWSYGRLKATSDRIAQVLVEDHGIVPGNRVVLRIPNTPWAVACWFGVLKAGAVVVTTMTAWRSSEIRGLVDKVRPQLLIVDHRHLGDVDDMIRGTVKTVVLGGEADELITATEKKNGAFVAVETAADDVALLGPTSGTTGHPKVTMHFHRDILATADTFARHTLGLNPDDVCASSAPLAFTFGLGALVIFPLRFGASSLLVERANPVEFAALVEDEGVTVLYTAPTAYRAILKEGVGSKLRGLRLAVSAGEHLPEETALAFEKEVGIRLINGIGATELLHVFISAAGDDIRPAATGRPVPGYRATVLDENDEEAPVGTIGRLAVIGPTGCRYLSDDRQSNYVVKGWNITGDMYLRDADGYFYYQARADSMIVTAGYNVGAPEVEAIINDHPDVLESAVVGEPDPSKGAIIVAYVVPRTGAQPDEALSEAIVAHVKDRIAIYKCPRRIEFLDQLPRNPSGKLQHFKLRERSAAATAGGHDSSNHEGTME